MNYGIKGTYRERIDGYMSYAPLITLHPDTKPSAIVEGALPFLAKIIPTLRVPVALRTEYITTDQTQIDLIKSRPQKPMCTAPQMASMIERGKKLVDKAYVAKFVDRPLAVFHGTSDYINHIKGTMDFFELAPVKDKKFYRYPEFYHDIFHETPERVVVVMKDVKDWLLEHTGKDEPKTAEKVVKADVEQPKVAPAVTAA